MLNSEGLAGQGAGLQGCLAQGEGESLVDFVIGKTGGLALLYFEIVSTFSPRFSSKSIRFVCRISISAACVASRNIGYVGAPISPVRPGFS